MQLNRWVDIVFQYLGKSLKTLPQKRDNRHITASALLVKDIEGVEIGYAYYKRTFDPEGKHAGTILFQCEADPNREEQKRIIHFLLLNV